MKFTIEKQPLFDALTKAARIAERRSTLPILSYVLLSVEGEILTVTATDLESGIRLSVPCESERCGQVCAPGKTILQAVSNLSDGPVSLSLDDNLRLSIQAGDASMSLACLSVDEYPAWTEDDEDTAWVTTSAGGLASALERVAFAASSDESRYGMNCVHFEREDMCTVIVATDGHRLAFDAIALDFGENFKADVPKKSIVELKKLLDEHTGDVKLGVNSKNLILKTEAITATARLASTDYPDFRKVIPTEPGYSFVVKRDSCVTTIKRVAFLLSERNKGMNFSITGQELTLSATHPDLGTARDRVAVEYDGEPIEAIINGAYLLEALNAFTAEKVRFSQVRERGPFILKVEGDEGRYFNLVMPMRR